MTGSHEVRGSTPLSSTKKNARDTGLFLFKVFYLIGNRHQRKKRDCDFELHNHTETRKTVTFIT